MGKKAATKKQAKPTKPVTKPAKQKKSVSKGGSGKSGKKSVSYCVCRQNEESFMVECSSGIGGCNGWFHPECCGLTLTQEQLDQIEHYTFACSLCVQAQQLGKDAPKSKKRSKDKEAEEAETPKTKRGRPAGSGKKSSSKQSKQAEDEMPKKSSFGRQQKAPGKFGDEDDEDEDEDEDSSSKTPGRGPGRPKKTADSKGKTPKSGKETGKKGRKPKNEEEEEGEMPYQQEGAAAAAAAAAAAGPRKRGRPSLAAQREAAAAAEAHRLQQEQAAAEAALAHQQAQAQAQAHAQAAAAAQAQAQAQAQQQQGVDPAAAAYEEHLRAQAQAQAEAEAEALAAHHHHQALLAQQQQQAAAAAAAAAHHGGGHHGGAHHGGAHHGGAHHPGYGPEVDPAYGDPYKQQQAAAAHEAAYAQHHRALSLAEQQAAAHAHQAAALAHQQQQEALAAQQREAAQREAERRAGRGSGKKKRKARGLRGNQFIIEKILGMKFVHSRDPLPEDPSGYPPDVLVPRKEEFYLVKWKGLSYLHASWERPDDLRAVDPSAAQKLKKWQAAEAQRQGAGTWKRLAHKFEAMEEEDAPDEYFDPEYVEVARLVACDRDRVAHADLVYRELRRLRGGEAAEAEAQGHPPTDEHLYDTSEDGCRYLVKWKGLPYSQASWETWGDLKRLAPATAVLAFWRAQRPPAGKVERAQQWRRPGPDEFAPLPAPPLLGLPQEEVSARETLEYTKAVAASRGAPLPPDPLAAPTHQLVLRDYQLQGLNWLLRNWYHQRPCVLNDEAGLGKTVQAVSLLHELYYGKATALCGPFLVVCARAEVGRWQRELTDWSPDLNVVGYAGNAEARHTLKDYELHYQAPHVAADQARALTALGMVKVDAVVVPFDLAVSDREVFRRVPWKALVIDDAHRLVARGPGSRLFETLATFPRDWALLLTNSPDLVAQRPGDLWALLKLAAPGAFPDKDDFVAQYQAEQAAAEKARQEREAARAAAAAAAAPAGAPATDAPLAAADASADAKAAESEPMEAEGKGESEGQAGEKGEGAAEADPAAAAAAAEEEEKKTPEAEAEAEAEVAEAKPMEVEASEEKGESKAEEKADAKTAEKEESTGADAGALMPSVEKEADAGVEAKKEEAKAEAEVVPEAEAKPMEEEPAAAAEAAVEEAPAEDAEAEAEAVAAGAGAGGDEEAVAAGEAAPAEMVDEAALSAGGVPPFLQAFVLRRTREEVQVPDPGVTEEVVVCAALTPVQRRVYRAVYERNSGALFAGGQHPHLRQVAQDLLKCCNHPYLLAGVEERVLGELPAEQRTPAALHQQMVDAGGKFLLLDKLLPKLQAEGRKVLVLCRMVRVLDYLEEFLRGRAVPYERVDATTRASHRAAAVDRFARPAYGRAVLLLSATAEGLGLNLTPVDTVVLFDSGPDPTRDLGDQMRAHRIGRGQPLAVYRLLMKGSYEMHRFQAAARRLAAGEALPPPEKGPRDKKQEQAVLEEDMTLRRLEDEAAREQEMLAKYEAEKAAAERAAAAKKAQEEAAARRASGLYVGGELPGGAGGAAGLGGPLGDAAAAAGAARDARRARAAAARARLRERLPPLPRPHEVDPQRLYPGDRVAADFQGRGSRLGRVCRTYPEEEAAAWAAAKARGRAPTGVAVDILFDHGAKEVRVAAARVHKVLGVGDNVLAHFMGMGMRPGKILRAHRDGTYDVRFDHGAMEMCITTKKVLKVETKRSARDPLARPPKELANAMMDVTGGGIVGPDGSRRRKEEELAAARAQQQNLEFEEKKARMEAEAKELDQLLRHGAYGVFREGRGGQGGPGAENEGMAFYDGPAEAVLGRSAAAVSWKDPGATAAAVRAEEEAPRPEYTRFPGLDHPQGAGAGAEGREEPAEPPREREPSPADRVLLTDPDFFHKACGLERKSVEQLIEEEMALRRARVEREARYRQQLAQRAKSEGGHALAAEDYMGRSGGLVAPGGPGYQPTQYVSGYPQDAYDKSPRAARSPKPERAKKEPPPPKEWGPHNRDRVLRSLLTFGFGRWERIRREGGAGLRSVEAVEAFARAYVLQCGLCARHDGHEGQQGQKESQFVRDAIKAAAALDEAVRSGAKEFSMPAILQEERFVSKLKAGEARKALNRLDMLVGLQRRVDEACTKYREARHMNIFGHVDDQAEGVPPAVLAQLLQLGDVRPVWTRVTAWWDLTCDRHLLVGCFLHGFGKYERMKQDPNLCFQAKMTSWAKRHPGKTGLLTDPNARARASAAAAVALAGDGSDRESRFLGVYSQPGSMRWCAMMNLGEKKHKYLGAHDTEELAAKVYDAAVRQMFMDAPDQQVCNFDLEGNRNDYVVGLQNNNCQLPWHRASSYRGVRASGNKWTAQISYGGLNHHLGTYMTEIEAAVAYDSSARDNHSEGAILNFPNGAPQAVAELEKALKEETDRLALLEDPAERDRARAAAREQGARLRKGVDNLRDGGGKSVEAMKKAQAEAAEKAGRHAEDDDIAEDREEDDGYQPGQRMDPGEVIDLPLPESRVMNKLTIWLLSSQQAMTLKTDLERQKREQRERRNKELMEKNERRRQLKEEERAQKAAAREAAALERARHRSDLALAGYGLGPHHPDYHRHLELHQQALAAHGLGGGGGGGAGGGGAGGPLAGGGGAPRAMTPAAKRNAMLYQSMLENNTFLQLYEWIGPHLGLPTEEIVPQSLLEFEHSPELAHGPRDRDRAVASQWQPAERAAFFTTVLASGAPDSGPRDEIMSMYTQRFFQLKELGLVPAGFAPTDKAPLYNVHRPYAWEDFVKKAGLQQTKTPEQVASFYTDCFLPTCLALCHPGAPIPEFHPLSNPYPPPTHFPDPARPIEEHSQVAAGSAYLFLCRQQILRTLRYAINRKPDSLLKFLKAPGGLAGMGPPAAAAGPSSAEGAESAVDGVPFWWCPWIHDYALVLGCLKHGYLCLNLIRSDKTLPLNQEKIQKHVLLSFSTKLGEMAAVQFPSQQTAKSAEDERLLLQLAISQFPSKETLDQRMKRICLELTREHSRGHPLCARIWQTAAAQTASLSAAEDNDPAPEQEQEEDTHLHHDGVEEASASVPMDEQNSLGGGAEPEAATA